MENRASAKIYANFSGGLVTEANALQAPDNSVVDIENLNIKKDGSVEVRPGLEFDSSPEIQDISLNGYSILDTATAVFKWEGVNGDPSTELAVIQIGRTLRFYEVQGGVINTAEEYAPSIPLFTFTGSSIDLVASSPIQVASGGGRLYIVGKYSNPTVLTLEEDPTNPSIRSVKSEPLTLFIRDFKILKEGETVEGFEYENPNAVGLSYPYNRSDQPKLDKTLSLSGEGDQQYVSGAHAYNLINQGWPESEEGEQVYGTSNLPQVGKARISTTGSVTSGSTADTSVLFRTVFGIGRAPNVYESFHTYQNGGGTSIEDQVAFQPNYMKQTYTGNTIAARGHLIKEAFNIERQAAGYLPEFAGSTDGIVELYYDTRPELKEMLDNLEFSETEVCSTRPDSIAFYAGRVWYAGQEGTGFSRNIYFSQVVGNDSSKASKCYQAADPTAEDINELVATDGGVLAIEGMGKVFRIITVGPSLLVITDSGVWAISGETEGANFTATSYSVRKITSQGAISKNTIVEARDSVLYWSDASINMLSFDAIGAISMQDVSSDKIRSYYAEVKDFAKASSYSKYDEGADNVLWFFSSTPDKDLPELVGKTVNKVLSLNLSTGAYSKLTLSTTDDIVPVAVIDTEASSTITNVDIVTDSDGSIVTADGAAVTANTTVVVAGRTSLKLLTMVRSNDSAYPWYYRFSEFTDIDTFTDWGSPYNAFLESGFDSLQDVITEAKKAPLFVTHLKRTETGFKEDSDLSDNDEVLLNNPSSCLVSYSWDWGSSNYRNQFQAYRFLKNYTPANITDKFDYDRDIITSHTRLRGRGMSLGIRIDAEPGYNMKLLGYGIVFTSRGR